jgi:hypothetical protein
MMLKIWCTMCGNVGVVSAERLPAELRCWQCGTSRRVEKGARIKNPVAVMERILGDARPIDAPSGG